MDQRDDLLDLSTRAFGARVDEQMRFVEVEHDFVLSVSPSSGGFSKSCANGQSDEVAWTFGLPPELLHRDDADVTCVYREGSLVQS